MVGILPRGDKGTKTKRGGTCSHRSGINHLNHCPRNRPAFMQLWRRALVIKYADEMRKKVEFPGHRVLTRLSDTAARRREAAIGRLKLLVPALFALGFMFYAALSVYPLAGMPGPPLTPFGGARPLLLWLAVACASGGLFALFGALVVAVSASAEGEA